MFNVIIVDDDKIVIDGLRKVVDWNSFGYQVVGSAQSADEAIRIIENEVVDCLLTDIVMPLKDGLELIKEAQMINPFMKAVILSGYGEFGYAKEALKLGAFDYLTKPVDFDELRDVFTNLNGVLQNEKKQRQENERYRSLIHTQFLNNLVSEFYKDKQDKIEEKMNEIGLDIQKGRCCLIRLLVEECLDTSKENEYLNLKQNVLEKASIFLEGYGRAYFFDNNLNEIAALFYPENSGDFENFLICFSEYVKTIPAVKVFIGVGSLCENITDSARSYNEAGRALDYRFIKKENNLFYYSNMAEFFKARSVITSDIEADIQEYLSSGVGADLEKYIRKILLEVKELEQSNKGTMFETCIEIILITNKYLGNYVKDGKLLKRNDFDDTRTLLKTESFEQISDFILKYLEESMSVINSNREKPTGLVIENVLKYLHEHFNEDISLSKLSKIVYVHPAYLSKLFKEKTGENFVDYLAKIRIEQATKLLNDVSLCIYDVSIMVGYESPKHFRKVFKEITGTTPRNYRNGYPVKE